MALRSLIVLSSAATLLLGGCGQSGQIAAEAAQPATSSTPSAKESVSTTKPTPAVKGRASREASAPSTPSAKPSSKVSATSSARAAAKKSSQPSPATAAPATNATRGAYIDYATWDSSRSKYAGTDVVLFFHAPWCPKCRDTDASAKSGMPAGLTLVKIDYDNATGLRQTYGVTLQHTFVQVDRAGKATKKWVGTYTDNSVAWVKSQTV